jgi:predicted nuclease of restriction endonuclease-like RecB superfamily
MGKKRLVKPATVLNKWHEYQQECKDNKKRPLSKVAKQYAKLCGMKSMGEVRCAADMDDKKIPYVYEQDILPYVVEANYNPDFTVMMRTKAGVPVYIEYKGKMTQPVRSKMAAVKKCHPEKRICLVFERAENKLSSKPNSMRYWRWAELNGFPWSEHYMKIEWLKERFWKEWHNGKV